VSKARPYPDMRAGPCSVGCEAQGKAQELLFRLGVTGEGKAGHGVNNSEALLMPRDWDSPGRIVIPGRQGHAIEMWLAAVKEMP
jgi:hypothetical protein